MPPVRNQDEPSEAKIVTELGRVFNIDEVYSGESSFIGSLRSVGDFEPVEVPPSHPIKFDEDMVEVCDLSFPITFELIARYVMRLLAMVTIATSGIS